MPLLHVQGVHKWLGANHVLRGIDLTVERGEIVVVIGPSGSGKSTLLRCINHLERVDGGTIQLEDDLVGYVMRKGELYEQSEPEIARIRRRIGFVFQQFNLFPHMTALDNVTSARSTCAASAAGTPSEQAHALLERVGLADKARRVPGTVVRRPAAARRDRPRAGDASRGDAVRRADAARSIRSWWARSWR